MDINVKTWLYDILTAIHEIESFFIDTPKDFVAYQNDVKTRRAIERNIEIIGEPMHRVLNQQSDLRLSSSRKIVDTRNRIIHGYDTVSDDIIWGIVITHLPVLKSEIEHLLSE